MIIYILWNNPVNSQYGPEFVGPYSGVFEIEQYLCTRYGLLSINCWEVSHYGQSVTLREDTGVNIVWHVGAYLMNDSTGPLNSWQLANEIKALKGHE